MSIRENHFSQKESYTGERYAADLSPEEYTNRITRAKGYSMIAAILHAVIGLLPAMALAFAPVAIFYVLGLFLVIFMTIRNYRVPAEPRDLPYPEYDRLIRRPRLFCNIQRLLVLLALIFDVVFTYAYQLGVSVWFILQLILFLLEALDLQFLFRLQRDIPWSART